MQETVVKISELKETGGYESDGPTGEEGQGVGVGQESLGQAKGRILQRAAVEGETVGDLEIWTLPGKPWEN